MERLVRQCYKQGGYAFAKKAEDVGREYGISRIARLASNENPYLPSPEVIAAAEEAIRAANRYPDEKASVLTSALKVYYGDYNFVTGVGMDGVIETLIRTLVEPGETIAVSTPTFSFYGLAAVAQSAKVVSISREKDFTVSAEKLIAGGCGAKIVVLCTPNNPTGNATPPSVVQDVLERIDGVLFLDNAYVEFSGIDYLPLLKKYDNLVIGRTFSKAYALAGLRIGYAFVPGWLAPYYARASTPFTVNAVSAAAAAAALSDKEHPARYAARVLEWRKRFAEKIKFPVMPSDANFVMVDISPYTGDSMVQHLAQQGVIVRSCRSFSGLPDHYIRVSIGEDWENELFVQVINNL
jgi:histidinol-phosphate aminotransferase